MADLSEQLEGLTQQQGEILKQMEDTNKVLAAKDDRYAEAKAALDTLAGQMATITQERIDKERDAEIARHAAELAEIRKDTRTPSKADVIGTARSATSASSQDFFWATWAARNSRFPEFHAEGKAILDSMGVQYGEPPPGAKATLGNTGAAGGNIVPNAVLGPIVEITTAINIYRNLLTVYDAGFVSGVAIPTESLIPVAATVQAYGATKTNVNLTVGQYTATMYTIAAIYDVGNQLLRNSRGAAEGLVRGKLSRSIALGESNYILNGTGTSEPQGLLPAIGASGTFVTSFTASSTTLAGSSAAAIAKATGVLANRARQPDGVVVNASDFWIMASQGTDTAGFFFNPAGGPSQINPTIGMLRVWGLPVYADPQMPTDSMVVGEWKSATLYTGQTYRVDVSDTAGTRWDTNETGFRGEEELGFNASPYVAAGMFQRVIDFTP